MRITKKKKKGTALPIAILTVMLVLILSVALLDLVSNEIRVQKTTEQRVIAKYLAEAGIEHGFYLYTIKSEEDLLAESPYNGNIEKNGLIGSYILTYRGEGEFEAAGITPANRIHRLSVALDNDGNISRWEEIK